MLSKYNRFSGPRATDYVRRKGRAVRCGPLSARIAPARTGYSRVAVTVSKKVDKRAVVRNRIRRRIYESLRRSWPTITHPVDVSIGVFDGSLAEATSTELESAVQDLLAKAGLLRDSSLDS